MIKVEKHLDAKKPNIIIEDKNENVTIQITNNKICVFFGCVVEGSMIISTKDMRKYLKEIAESAK